MQAEQEIQQLIRLLQSYQETIQVLERQRMLLDATIEDHDAAQEALAGLEDLDEEGTIIVPVGANQFLYASITDTDHVLSSVGADVVLEESTERALERSKKRVEELEEGKEQIATRIEEVAEEAEKLQARIEELYRGAQRSAGPGPST